MACFNRVDHGQQQAIAKWNRRMKLRQQFLALAAIVPGTENVDDASVLEKSIEYLKQLKDRVKTLEEQNQKLPQIEARVFDRHVVIRIHCQLCKGALVKVLEETEKLQLSIISSSAIQFGSSTLVITIMAEMDDDVIVTVKDMVESVRSSLIQFTGNDRLQEQAY